MRKIQTTKIGNKDYVEIIDAYSGDLVALEVNQSGSFEHRSNSGITFQGLCNYEDGLEELIEKLWNRAHDDWNIEGDNEYELEFAPCDRDTNGDYEYTFRLFFPFCKDEN